MSIERRQVVIVGAGPVGLLTALGLARQGVEVTVLDSEPEVVRSPRAAVYFHTTISILRKLGLSEEAHDIGLSSTEFMMHWLDTGERVSSDMRDALEPGQEFDHNLHFGQHILAELVMRHLAKLPRTEVLWNHTVKALAQTDGEVRVAVDTEDGEVIFEADWVIGTDGARSTRPRSSSACPSVSRRSCPIRRCPTASTTSRLTGSTSAARQASGSAACCWQATRPTPATRAVVLD